MVFENQVSVVIRICVFYMLVVGVEGVYSGSVV